MGRHAKKKNLRPLLAAAAVVPVIGASLAASPAQASVSSPGNAALNWEETHAAGCWYAWGGTSCGQGYDCSGVVYEAFLHQGINLGRSTYDMLRSPHLREIPVSEAQRGDLLFYGSGHVEIKTLWYHVSYGAHDYGTRVGYAHWNGWWAPTMAFEVIR